MALPGYTFDFQVSDQDASSEVFADPTMRRRARTRHYALAFFLAAATWLVFFFGPSISLKTPQGAMPLVTSLGNVQTVETLIDDADLQPTFFEGAPRPGNPILTPFAESQTPCPETGAPLFSASAAEQIEPRLFAMLPSEKEWAYLSLHRECGTIDVLMPDWFMIENADLSFTLQPTDPEATQAIGRYIAQRGSGLDLFPIVHLANGIDRVELARNLSVPARRAALGSTIRAAGLSVGAAGICMDFGRIEANEVNIIASFLTFLRTTLANSDLKTCAILRATDESWNSGAMDDAADYFIVKMFEEPWIGTPPGPIAQADWFADTAQSARDRFGADRLVLALGTGSVDWIAGNAVPETIDFAQAIGRIAAAGARIAYEPGAGNSYATFVDSDGQRHQLWMLDAISLHNQLATATDLGIANVAVWGLGSEDPGIWPRLIAPFADPVTVTNDLGTVTIRDYVTHSGTGPFYRIAKPYTTGIREISFAENGNRIDDVEYVALPQPAVIERFGQGEPNQIVLSFDDGPHEEYTRDILDTLKETDTPATFFLVGSNILGHKGLVRRMVDEGHEVGSHTFWHPLMSDLSETRTALELNLFQKILSGVTGRGTYLFREPFQRSTGPLGGVLLEPMRLVQNAGYFYAGSDITPPDWDNITAEEIVAYIERELAEGTGNIIVLHDAGADRSETVRALPMIISSLRAKGYEFVGMSDLLGLPDSELMPPIENYGTLFYSLSFNAFGSLRDVLTTIFFAAILIGVVRSTGMLLLALRRKKHPNMSGAFTAPVTVVIPAFNEESSIVASVESVLALKYPNLKVLVVDDGSNDNTFTRLIARFGRNPRVKVIAKLNQGKWSALNTAMRLADTEFVISIDADTRIDEIAVTRLVSHFKDPFVGAVAGKVVIDNRVNLLTRLQALEYITAQNIDRRAAEYLNAMLVVPGAIGAWRVSAVKASGGYSGDTLTEDADLTVSMLRSGYHIHYEENAVASTLAPTRIKQLLTQRLRWSLGMLQTGWKHRGAVREGKALGFVALPDLLLFGYLLPILAPVADVLFLKLIVEMLHTAWTGSGTVSEMSKIMILAYIALPLMDIITALTAMAFDTRENPAQVLLFPLQRFFYRQLLYFSVLRALIRATTGRLAKWTKAHRMYKGKAAALGQNAA